MTTIVTTTKESRGRRKFVAIGLVALGVLGLGVASASQLTVNGTDGVAAGVTTTLTGCTGTATAKTLTTAAPAKGASWTGTALRVSGASFTLAATGTCTGTATIQLLNSSDVVLATAAATPTVDGSVPATVYTAAYTDVEATTATVAKIAIIIVAP